MILKFFMRKGFRAGLLGLLLMTMSGCFGAKVNSSPVSASALTAAFDPSPNVRLADMVIAAYSGQSAKVLVELTSGRLDNGTYSLSFLPDQSVSTMDTALGKVEIVDSSRGIVRFSSKEDSVGEVEIDVYAISQLLKPVHGKVRVISMKPASLASDPSLKMTDKVITTYLNRPIKFTIELNGGTYSEQTYQLSLDIGSIVTSAAGAYGKLELLDPATGLFQYTPKFGFRGEAVVNVYALSKKYQLQTSRLDIFVRNPVMTFKPAVAARAIGCTLCHARISGDLITDFGYGGDGKGLDYYWGQAPGVSYGPFSNIYGDHDPASDVEGSFNLGAPSQVSNGSVVVPNVDVPTEVRNAFGKNTLPVYLRDRLGLTDDKTVAATSVYIGAPTAEKVRQIGDFSGTEKWKFYKDSSESPDLTGFVYESTKGFFTNSPSENFVCEGDLVIDGILYLDNVTIETETGCRIYTTQTVVVDGPINFAETWPKTNIQISSARAILLGVSSAVFNDRIYTHSEGWRHGDFMFTRAPGTVAEKIASIASDMALLGNRVDASDQPSGRGVPFSRILLNAPHVQSRYSADFRGTIITEILYWSLGQFKFEYDPVFTKVPILPMLRLDEILSVQ